MVVNKEEKVNLDTGEYCTCVGKGYLETIVPHWEGKPIPIQGLKFSSASESMKPLRVIDLTLIFPHPSQCIRLKVEFVVMDFRLLRTVGHNEQVEVTTPFIITWHNGKSKMVGDFRALSTYTISDRYPIPRIHETLTQSSQVNFITAMDALKGFHQNVLTDSSKRLLRIIFYCGIV
ncbi:hypothetical protein O181_107206 [Austropuccinia psidii MF-1]|uniref:Reverse transcriptase domain-containing protein n=1 Tax=Austropuccinia psidii MF-1 TaxID=1389203 RepID=A0A9Q3JSW8_9BASI|nr:hypothetical protein [Austropuccinia psidii MF-1]